MPKPVDAPKEDEPKQNTVKDDKPQEQNTDDKPKGDDKSQASDGASASDKKADDAAKPEGEKSAKATELKQLTASDYRIEATFDAKKLVDEQKAQADFH